MARLLPFLRPTSRDADASGVHARVRDVATDAELVTEMREGRSSAVAQLFDRHGARVRRIIRSVLGPAESEIEDLVHEVFVRALQGIATLERQERVEHWLVGIAVFVSRESIRSRTRARFFPLFADVPETAECANGAASEAVVDVFSILRKMPADERVVFSLRFIEGMDLAEVALACDTSVSTAKRRIRDAETRFRRDARAYTSLEPWLAEVPCRR